MVAIPIAKREGAQSPFAPILAEQADLMSRSFHDQYMSDAEASYEVWVVGRMERIWHRPRWLWPVLWLLARGDILFPETGERVPTALRISPGRDARGAPIQTWERTFRFPRGRRRRFRSTMTYDASTARIAEREGPWNAIEELVDVRFSPPATIEFASHRSALVIKGRRLHLPRRLWVTAHVVQRETDPTTGASHIALTVTHGMLGPVFGYEGDFRTVRRPRTM